MKINLFWLLPPWGDIGITDTFHYIYRGTYWQLVSEELGIFLVPIFHLHIGAWLPVEEGIT